jgi:hypothetical protein
MICESQSNRTATEIITNQLQALQDAGLLSNNSLFLTVICSNVFQPPHDFALTIFEDLWYSFKIIDVTLVIPYSKKAETYLSAIPSVHVSSNVAAKLYTWYPSLARGRCVNVSRVDVIDKWLVENTKGFLKARIYSLKKHLEIQWAVL